ncbi:MAG: poly-gamma-glutamate biosynthesis protein PgsC [Candidatus Brocadiae bacterium]|nr:poly-gamma-glutamate biosynthesis protein PgsC [Candidatus Brocadiia bacterium]
MRERLLLRVVLINLALCGVAAAAASPAVTGDSRLVEAIAIGLVTSLIFSETLGLATGGMIVPGYMAIVLHQPARVATTIAVALATFLLVRFLGRHMLIYGRRRTVMIMLVAFTLGWLSRLLISTSADIREPASLYAIGFIIPGLIADWMERQGLVQTVSSMITASVLVRLVLIATGPRTFA